ncbi:hypothetical protein FE257_006522 [Aspergillus nanangensis]|uniref:Uncharacterized protein n=1 Tax=Aspergillus nanangensis TaxID=2582783 RepID=A0AAD4CXP3_ASPNN|nr:hypothetical protein FE257_006522 [Aspergillus nanangensis]
MQVALFGSDIYTPSPKLAHSLSSDVKLIPELRKSWDLAKAPKLFGKCSQVGKYDTSEKNVVLEEAQAWARKLQSFPDIPLATDSPPRLGLAPRGEVLLAALNEAISVPNTPYWNAVAEGVYGLPWCLLDTDVLCPKCVMGECVWALLATYADYYHFCGSELAELLKACTKRVQEHIEHVQHDHDAGGPERMAMDSCAMATQGIYLNVLHDKAKDLQFPDDEFRSIRYRLIESGARSFSIFSRAGQYPLVDAEAPIEAVAFAALAMHDICDARHDNRAHEFYNLVTIVSGHTGKLGINMVRRLFIDVWAWAIDHREDWAIHYAGRILAWQLYMKRYQTALLLDNLQEPNPSLDRTVDPYGDQVLNDLNPLKMRSPMPFDFDVRSRCQNKSYHDEMYNRCLRHFETCPGCNHYDDKNLSWEDWIERIGSAFERKYTDCTCLNTIATYMMLSPLRQLWWAPDPTAKYTGPQEDWSPMLN